MTEQTEESRVIEISFNKKKYKKFIARRYTHAGRWQIFDYWYPDHYLRWQLEEQENGKGMFYQYELGGGIPRPNVRFRWPK